MAYKITDDQNYSDIADAIREKLGSQETFLPSEMASAIQSITGGETTEYKTKFVDYDGTVLYSYTQDEVDALTELPSLPSHAGLICQEWNWSLSDIKALGRQVIVGANYITDDGKTRLYIHIPEYDKTVYSYFKQTKTRGVTVNWGDGSADETFSSLIVNTSHTYTNAGDYVITFNVTNGLLRIEGDSAIGMKLIWGNQAAADKTYDIASNISKVELGSGVQLYEYGFRGATNIESISIPNSISFYTTSGVAYLGSMSALKCVVIPKGITVLPPQMCINNYTMKYASIPNGVTRFWGITFSDCHMLKSFTIPDTVTEIGNKAFYICKGLEDIKIPSTVTTFGEQVFYQATGFNDTTMFANMQNISEKCFASIDLKTLVLNDETLTLDTGSFASMQKLETFRMEKVPASMEDDSITYIGAENVFLPEGLTKICNAMFSGNEKITEITIPSTVTSIGSTAFRNCTCLKRITLPSGLTELKTEVFYGCVGLTELVIPAGIHQIPNYLCNGAKGLRAFICLGNIESISSSGPFGDCKRIFLYDFSHCTQVPAVTSNTFLVVNPQTKIKIPAALYNDWIAESHWANYASYIEAV